jgi:ribonuclease III
MAANDDLMLDAELDALKACEEVLGYEFRDKELLKNCLTHASVAKTRLASNERLEFLGDSVLGLVVCEALFHRFPDLAEGELTRMKSVLVSRKTCAEITTHLNLDRFLYVGKGLTTHDRVPPSVLAAVIESLIAGVYLDGGLEAARDLVERLLDPEIERVARLEHRRNYKSLLQQLAQRQFGETPVYRLLDEKGPDHSKCFKISAVIGNSAFAAAWGASKKEAEQRAAHNAFAEIAGEEAPYLAD